MPPATTHQTPRDTVSLTAVAASTAVTALIPASAATVTKHWRKTLRAIDPTQPRGFAIVGDWLDAGAMYRMPRGGLIVGYDFTGVHQITVWRVDGDADLTEVATIIRKGATWAGPATLKKLTQLAAAAPWPGGKVVKTEHAPNATAGTCVICEKTVDILDGVQARNRHGKLIVGHRPGACTPPIVPNRYAGPCEHCGGWLDTGEGTIVDTGLAGYRPVHGKSKRDCPVGERRRPPLQPNLFAEPCEHCWQIVDEGAGSYDWITRRVSHGSCPPYGCVVWTTETVTATRTRAPKAGDIMRVAGLAGDMLLPLDAPGRRLNPTLSAIMVAVAVSKTWYRHDDDIHPYPVGWVTQGAWRPATVVEATGVLAAEFAEANRLRLTIQARQMFPDDSALRAPGDTRLPGVLDLPGVRSAALDLGDTLFGRYTATGGTRDHLRIDTDNGLVWSARFNGGEHDDWADSNHGRWVLTPHELTDTRRSAIDQLTAEFGAIGTVEDAPDTELTHAVAVFSVLYVPPPRRSLDRPRPPWVAELTGLDPTYRYRRVFLDRMLDYRRASASLETGLQVCWTLESGRVYEAWHRINRRGQGVREFLTVTVAGDIRRLDEEEVRAWLRKR